MFESLSNRKDWPVKPLAAVIRINKESRFHIEDLEEYRILGVTNRGAGVVVKRTVRGTDLTMREYQRASGNQLMWCKVDTKNGAFGVTTGAHVDCLASPNMCLADVDTTVIEPRLLQLFFQVPAVVDGITAASLGTTNRQYLKPREFLDTVRLRLPPLAEQRRVVARIEELAAQIQEARTLRQQAVEEAEAIYSHARDERFRRLGCPHRLLGEVFDLINGRAFKPQDWQPRGRRIVRIQNLKYPSASYNHFSGAVDPRHLVADGDVLFAWSGQIVSLGAHIWQGGEAVLNQHIFNVRSRVAFMPQFVKEGFNALIDEMKDQVRGLEMFHIRKQELVKLSFPVPSLADQRAIVAELDALQAQVDGLKRLQADTAAELDALLPSILDRAFKGEL